MRRIEFNWTDSWFHRWVWVVRNLEGSRGQVVEDFIRLAEKYILDLKDHEEILKVLSNMIKAVLSED